MSRELVSKLFLKNLRRELMENERIQELLVGKEVANIDKAITFKPRINATGANEDYKIDNFITLSINRVSQGDSDSQWAIKVGVATNTIRASDEDILKVFDILEEINKVITQEELNFGFSEQILFSEMEESFFDQTGSLYGYIAIYVVLDEPY